MMRLRNTPLEAKALRQLSRYQNQIDALPDYEQRVAAAKDKFEAHNVRSNPTFQEIKATLSRLCSGARRCMYCEDSYADEVEHIRPKDLYPEFVFVWENYLYACGPCNSPKNNRFAVFSYETGQIKELTATRRTDSTTRGGRTALD